MSSGTHGSPPAPDLRARLQHALRAALKARDTAAVSALRSAQAALSNAEAVAPPHASPAPVGDQHVAGAAVGLGAAEAPRRIFTEERVSELLRAEIAERHDAARLYEPFGHSDRADRLQREADVLSSVLGDAG